MHHYITFIDVVACVFWEPTQESALAGDPHL